MGAYVLLRWVLISSLILLTLTAQAASGVNGDAAPLRGPIRDSADDESIDLSDIPQSLKPGKKVLNVPNPGVDMYSKVAELSRRVQTGANVDLLPLPESKLIPLGQQLLPPIKLEATYEEPIDLHSALELALENNLAIKASRADYDTARYRYVETFGHFLPWVSTSFIPIRAVGPGLNLRTNPYFVFLYYPVFQGFRNVCGTAQAKHQMRASRYGLSAETNNILLDVFEKYMDVLQNRALLEVRTVAVDVAKEQHRTNRYMRAAGLGNAFEVMQSATLLAEEKQRLIRAEVNLRQSVLKLAVSLNIPVHKNLIPAEKVIPSEPLIDPLIPADNLTSLALLNRPEVSKYEKLREAARLQIPIAGSRFLPEASFFQGAVINTQVSGRGATGPSSLVVPVSANLAAGAVSTGTNANNSFISGFLLNWTLAGMGVGDTANVMAAKAQARKALIELNKSVLDISEQVHSAYIEYLAAGSEIDVANEAVSTAAEEMRLADQRLKYQLGTNLELVQAEKDFIEAITRRVQTIARYRKSQGRLLHAIGKISVDSLTASHPATFDIKR